MDLVVWDTVTHLSSIRDENNNSEVAAALMPLDQLVVLGIGVLAIHHHGWETGRSRGASEFYAWADYIIEYHDVGKQYPRRRMLDVKGRSDRMPYQLTVELSEDHTAFTRVEAAPAIATADLIDSLLPVGEPGLTVEEIHDRLPPGTLLSLKTLKNQISEQRASRGWCRSGDGVSGRPYRYFKPSANGHPEPSAPATRPGRAVECPAKWSDILGDEANDGQ